MLTVKSTAIFSGIMPSLAQKPRLSVESKKVSYWLEKLHIQRSLQNDAKESSASSTTDFNMAQSVINEQAKNEATKKEADRQVVNDLVKRSNRLIIAISSVFPWSLFPNTIEVEESRVTFKFNQLFSTQSHSVDIKDISNVFIESSLFFSTLQVVSRTYIQNDIKIGSLSKNKAKKVQRIIEGLRTFAEHNINTSNYQTNELISKIEEFHAQQTT